MKQLEQAKKDGKADEDAYPLLDLINSKENMYTTSSCAGRICLLETTRQGSKKDARLLERWHREITIEDLKNALEKHAKTVAYLQSECPILHVVTNEEKTAEKLVKTGLELGFKRSGIKNLKEGRILVEICSSEFMETPLAEDGKLRVNGDYLKFIVDIANIKFRRGREKLKKLEECMA